MERTPTSAATDDLAALSAELDAALAETGGSRAQTGAADRHARHRRLAGILMLVQAGLALLAAAGYVALLVLATVLMGEDPLDGSVTGLGGPLAGFGVVAAVTYAAVAGASGVAYMRGSDRARVPLTVAALLALLFFPVGTALGGYVLWTLATTGRSA